jgi:hypothetical protein
VREALAELAQQDFGYPLGVNEVRPTSPTFHTLPSELAPLYAAFDGVSLPDVHVGYFIDPAARVESSASRGEPTRFQGGSPQPIRVFGSDGGGGRFALGESDNAVYYLPSAGAVKAGTYVENSAAPVRRVAGSVGEFLGRLKMDIEAFLRDDKAHAYMA